MNLVRAELSRLAARRFVQLMVVLLIGAFAVTAATTLLGSSRPSAEVLAQAQGDADRERALQLQNYRGCLEVQRPGTSEDVRSQFPTVCVEPDPAAVRTEDFVEGAFVFAREIRGLVHFLVAFLVLFGFLVGASFIGAELTSGGMTNLLLWESRRARVLAAKLGTVLGAVTAVAAAATVLYVAAFRLIASVAGLPGLIDAELWSDLALTTGRGLATTLVATAAGFAIATLGRHTAAALGVGAAYLVLWEGGARVVMSILDLTAAETWMLSTYVVAWSTGHLTIHGVSCGYVDPTCVREVTSVHAALLFGVLLAALLGATFRSFTRRDLA